MVTPRFLQIHTLHSYPAALLNRDDSGLAKRMPFGGVTRTRISSQCLKRHWRVAQDEYALGGLAEAAGSFRSRNIIDRQVMEPLAATSGASEDVLKAVGDALNLGVYGGSGTSETGRQPLLLGQPEVEYLRQKAAAICAEYPNNAAAAGGATTDLFQTTRGEGQNFSVFRRGATLPAGLEGALFGRMVTSDPAANIDAAVHVAHAFTVHAEESESDYFSVVDDLQREDEDPGAAHIGDMELTAGLFYGYVVVDVVGLVSNLEGCSPQDWLDADRELAGQVVNSLLHLIATVSPGAKLGSTAPYGRARFLLVEVGSGQPYSLADAFRLPARARLEDALQRLEMEIGSQDENYGRHGLRRYMSMQECHIPGGERLSLPDLATWAAGVVRSGEAK